MDEVLVERMVSARALGNGYDVFFTAVQASATLINTPDTMTGDMSDPGRHSHKWFPKGQHKGESYAVGLMEWMMKMKNHNIVIHSITETYPARRD